MKIFLTSMQTALGSRIITQQTLHNFLNVQSWKRLISIYISTWTNNANYKIAINSLCTSLVDSEALFSEVLPF